MVPNINSRLQITCLIIAGFISNISFSGHVVKASSSTHVRSSPAFVPSSQFQHRVGSDLPSIQLPLVLSREIAVKKSNVDLTVMTAKKRRKNSTTSRQESYTDDERERILSDLVERDNIVQSDRADTSSDGTLSDEPTRTLSGGPSLIFEMARRMLVWDDELYQGLNDASREGDESAFLSNALSNNASSSINTPRWRPSSLEKRSISNVNPAFRTSPPIMTSAGYAGILRRNSRKKMKPSMWRHTLRVYDRMSDLEKITINGKSESKKKAIRRKTVHHEAALVAAAKLAMWEEAIKIYRSVDKISSQIVRKGSKTVVNVGDGNAQMANNTDDGIQTTSKMKSASAVTDNMILSVISACIKGSRVKRATSEISIPMMNTTSSLNATNIGNTSLAVVASSIPSRRSGRMRLLSIDERRRPLDEARNILLSMEEKHDIPIVSHHVNPLAAAYIRLGLRSDATDLINMLKDRDPPAPPVYKKEKIRMINNYELDNESIDDYFETDEDDFKAGYEVAQLNINQVQAKDRGSYSLLVQGAVMEGDWVGAVEELRRMAEVGLHPNSRNLNSWAEAATERSSRPSRNNVSDNATYSRRGRKKRDRMWLDSLKR